MGKLKNKIAVLMYGRYGNDTLNQVLTIVYFVCLVALTIVGIFVKHILFWIIGASIIIALLSYITFRMMSKKIYARRRENEKFCGFFKLQRNKFRDRKTHVYRKCKSCKAVLRLPKAKGKHTVVCPRCKNRFEVRG